MKNLWLWLGIAGAALSLLGLVGAAVRNGALRKEASRLDRVNLFAGLLGIVIALVGNLVNWHSEKDFSYVKSRISSMAVQIEFSFYTTDSCKLAGASALMSLGADIVLKLTNGGHLENLFDTAYGTYVPYPYGPVMTYKSIAGLTPVALSQIAKYRPNDIR